MNCIVTAGPTYEPLDDVRRLTNFSTGRLGTELANYLTAHGHTVTLLLGKSATWHGTRHVDAIKYFSTTSDLQKILKAFSKTKADAIFHAAAVSDFAFGKMFIRGPAGKLVRFTPSRKIPTRAGTLLAELVPTPKIIAGLRDWFPRARIIGWKFEADGIRTDALSAARKQITDCRTNACVANGPAYGKGFGLVTSGKRKHFKSTEELFAALEILASGKKPS